MRLRGYLGISSWPASSPGGGGRSAAFQEERRLPGGWLGGILPPRAPHAGRMPAGQPARSRRSYKTLLAVEVPFNVDVLDVDHDRTAVRAGEGVRRRQQLRCQPRHLVAGERAVYFDGRLARQRGADFLPHVLDVRVAIVEGGVDQLLQESVEIVAHELRRQRRDGEGVAAEALDLEADGGQLVEMRLQHGCLRRAALVQDRREQALDGRGGGLDALPVAVVR